MFPLSIVNVETQKSKKGIIVLGYCPFEIGWLVEQ